MTWKPKRPHPRWRGRVLWIAVGMLLAITAFWGEALSDATLALKLRAEQKKDLVEFLKSI